MKLPGPQLVDPPDASAGPPPPAIPSGPRRGPGGAPHAAAALEAAEAGSCTALGDGAGGGRGIGGALCGRGCQARTRRLTRALRAPGWRGREMEPHRTGERAVATVPRGAGVASARRGRRNRRAAVREWASPPTRRVCGGPGRRGPGPGSTWRVWTRRSRVARPALPSIPPPTGPLGQHSALFRGPVQIEHVGPTLVQ